MIENLESNTREAILPNFTDKLFILVPQLTDTNISNELSVEAKIITGAIGLLAAFAAGRHFGKRSVMPFLITEAAIGGLIYYLTQDPFWVETTVVFAVGTTLGGLSSNKIE